jgi:hypothetical protein
VEKRLTILVGNVKKKFSNNKIGNVNCHEIVSATTSQTHQQLTDTSPLFGM